MIGIFRNYKHVGPSYPQDQGIRGIKSFVGIQEIEKTLGN